MNTGHMTLALDELLCTLTPERAAAIRAAVPPALRDQLDAATVEAALIATMSGSADSKSGLVSAQAVPGWLRLGLLDACTTWWTDRAETCLHAPHPSRPRPIVAAAWRPGMVVCAPCVGLLGLSRGSARDRTCDACGTVVAGVDQGEPMYPFSITSGVLTYLVGVCEGCRPEVFRPIAD